MIRNWRVQQGWTQYTAHDWAKEAGFKTISYGNWSVIESGKSGELRFASFLQFEELFRRLHENDYGTVANPVTLQRLDAAEPIYHPDDRPWDALDLIAHYLGRKSTPPELLEAPAPKLTDKVLKAQCSAWRKRVHELASQAPDRSKAIGRLIDQVPEAHEQRFTEFLMGFDYTHQELAELWICADCYEPGQWIGKWNVPLGGMMSALMA